MKKILLFGREGMLGTALHHVLARRHAVTALDRSQFDIIRADWKKLSIDGYDYVLNAAGLISRRQRDSQEFYTVNAVFPHVLSALCARSGARLVHFSTDCVFDGAQAPYYEDSPRGAKDLYGMSKAAGEPNLALTIRTSIIGPEVKNFYNLLCWSLTRDEISGFTNHFWNGVTTIELARMVNIIISEELYTEGVRHVFAGDISKCDLIAMLCGVFGHKARITPAPAPEARDTRLRTNFPEFLTQLGVRPLERQLGDLLAVTGPDGKWNKLRSSAA